MKNLRGILVAAVFAALTALLKLLAVRYDALMDLAYPFASRTIQAYLANWSAKTDICIWQVALAAFLVLVVLSIGLMILFRWNFFRWLGWVLAPVSIVYFIFTAVWGLNYYNRPIAEGMKLEVQDYTVVDLKDATIYYRDQANALAPQMPREENGDLKPEVFETLAQKAGDGFDNLVRYDSYSIFAGARQPVKKLNWSGLFSKFGTAGVTVGLTGEAAVNPNVYAATIPFNMCHEMAHRLAIASEDSANFAGYLACEANEDPQFRYSGYLMAYLYCSNALAQVDGDAWRAVRSGVCQELRHDLEANNQNVAQSDGPVKEQAQQAYSAFLEANGQEEGIKSYDRVSDLLVAWYLDQYAESDEPEPPAFDPFRYEDVFPESTAETTAPSGED